MILSDIKKIQITFSGKGIHILMVGERIKRDFHHFATRWMWRNASWSQREVRSVRVRDLRGWSGSIRSRSMKWRPLAMEKTFLPGLIGWYSSCGSKKHVNTCRAKRKKTHLNERNLFSIEKPMYRLPARQCSHRCRFGNWAAVALGSPITKRLSVVNWPVNTVNIVIDYPIHRERVIESNFLIHLANASVYYRANWERPRPSSYQFRLVSIQVHFYLHSNCSISSCVPSMPANGRGNFRSRQALACSRNWKFADEWSIKINPFASIIANWIRKHSTYAPIESFNVSRRFWSSLRMVSWRNLDMPLGRFSSTFCDKCKSVKFVRPLISSGNSSNLRMV